MSVDGGWHIPRPLHCPAIREYRYADGVYLECCAKPLGHTGDHTPTQTTATTGGWAQTAAGTIVYPAVIGWAS